MGNWPRLLNPRRCAFGRIVDAGESTNTTVALTNNSTGSENLLVWQLSNDVMTGAVSAFSYQQIAIMGTLGVVTAMIPGEAVPPGILSSGDQPAAFPVMWAPGAIAQGFPWPATFPMFVLLPGWSLVMQNIATAGGAVGVDIMWEAIKPELFDHIYMGPTLEEILESRNG